MKNNYCFITECFYVYRLFLTDSCISSEDFKSNNEDINKILEDPSDIINIDFENPEYLVSGAKLRCTCGSHTRLLNLPLCHGVYHIGHPIIHQKDDKVEDDQNSSTFGVCSSFLNPKKKAFGEKVTLTKEKKKMSQMRI